MINSRRHEKTINVIFVVVLSEKNIYNSQTNVSSGELYIWKSHLHCTEIASKLKMYDDCDEGVNESDFCDAINEEYNDLMINNEKDDIVRTFLQRLHYVCKHHLN